MEKVKVQIINKSGYKTPEYQTEKSAGCDLVATIDKPVTLKPLDRLFFNTKLSMAIPDGYEAQVRTRSGLNKRHGIVVIIGTIDADYRGEIGVILYNLSNDPFEVKPGERVAQLVISPVVQAEWEEVESLDETERGEGGFGSTGR